MGLPFLQQRFWRGGGHAAGPAAAPVVVSSEVTRQDDLINWWKMDEGTGSTATDSGSAAASESDLGLTNDASWGDGPHAFGGVILDGTDDHMTTSTVDLGLTDAFTISIWVKSNHTSATAYQYAYRALIEYAISAADPGFIIGWHPSTDATHMSIKVDSTVDTQYGINTPVTDVRNWANYIFTWASGTPMKHYSQGVLLATNVGAYTSVNTLTGNMANMTGDVLRIGIRQDYAYQSLNGEVSDARIYDVEFDQDDVDALYNSGDGDRG